jgi:signal transduction histidine kinase
MNWLRLATAGLAVPLGILAFRLQHDDLHQTVLRSVPAVAIAATAIAAGLVALGRRRARRMGWLMIAFGFAILIRPWQYSPDSGLFTVGFLLGGLIYPLFAHVALAYPSGRVRDPYGRWLLRIGYPTVLVLQLATLLVHEAGTRLKYAPLAPDSALLVWRNADLARALEKVFAVVLFGALTACFVLLVVRKLVRATPRGRRLLAPILLAAIVASIRALYEVLVVFVDPVPAFAEQVYWWQVVGQLALPITFLVGLLSSWLAAGHIAELVREVDRVPPGELRAALSRVVDDPSLELAFWLPERGIYADADGQPVELPEDGRRRAVTRLEHDGTPVAALIHDASLRDDPELIEAAGAAARLALENARLQAELKEQLVRVQESRARIVAAGDDQRRRIERDIHDGAQQRLVALALELRAAQKRLGGELAPAIEEVLSDAVDELQLAVGELRELARGVHPAILTEEGLGAALESLADRTPLAVTILTAPAIERFAPEIEGAAYFVACEALANAVKHADATSVTISAERRNGTLVIEVADDGIGGASLNGGSGLRGLSDRVEAHGGQLRIESVPGGGTRVIGELPCAS